MALYQIFNGPAPTTAAQAAVTTGTTAIKTLLQIKAGTTKPLTVVEWGISFDGASADKPIICELVETGAVAATVTAHVTAGIVKLDDEALVGGDPVTNLIPVGTTSTGYTASAEGTITATRVLDAQEVPPTGSYLKQYPLGQGPAVQVSNFLRVRITPTLAAAVNAICYVTILL